METKKVITFERFETLNKNRDNDKVEIESIFWTKVDGIVVNGSSSPDEKEAREFYDKVVELKGETTISTVLATHEIGMMSDEEAEHLYNGAEDAMIEQGRSA